MEITKEEIENLKTQLYQIGFYPTDEQVKAWVNKVAAALIRPVIKDLCKEIADKYIKENKEKTENEL